MLLGLPGTHYHLEFTQHEQGSPGPAPTRDNLLVLYFDALPQMKKVATRPARRATGRGADDEAVIRDEAISGDGCYLYAIHPDAQKLFGWAVGHGGQLTPAGEFGGVPGTVAGLAAS